MCPGYLYVPAPRQRKLSEDWATNRPPNADLIFDVTLPTLGGLELFEVMIRKGYETPAIFITGQPGVEAEMTSLEMGAADFLRKPIKKDVLLPRIRNILQRRNRSQAGGPRAGE